MAQFVHKLRSRDRHKSTEPYMCEGPGSEHPAVDKAVDYKENRAGNFIEVARHYWCGTHRKAGTITLRDGRTDPSDFEPISDMDDYTEVPDEEQSDSDS